MSIQEDMERELHGEIGEVSPRVDSAPPFPSGPDRSEAFILRIITEIFTQAEAFGADWHLQPADKGSEMWVSGKKDRGEGKATPLPEQGWKLHVSANPLSAEEALRRALPVLLSQDADFKVVSSIARLLQMNTGTYGFSQIGKFITVYPTDEDHAVRLAVALDEATRGLRGPGVPSDRPLARGSLVHYRYGGFSRHTLHDASGEALLAIRTPEGELVPDPRTPTYSPPDWAADPFMAGSVAADLPEQSLLIGGRYLMTTSIYGSARGSVYLGVDMAASRTCVLKHALRNGAMGMDGNDACDRLRNEAAVLARLAPDPRFPALYELVEHDGELYLAMEEVEGDTLYEHVRALAEQGRHVPQQQALTWVRELASMLETIHARGIVYRDLKPSSVIVTPGGGLRLLDFDVCLEIGAPVAIYSPGTFGYISRQQRAHEPPKITHDIYGLGAVLYFMATGAEPSEYSRPFDLLHRPLELLNPAISPELSAVIERCLDPDPRPSRLPQVGAAGGGWAVRGGAAAGRGWPHVAKPAQQRGPHQLAQYQHRERRGVAGSGGAGPRTGRIPAP